MELPDLKQLKAIIALCRKSGVAAIEINGIKLTLKDQDVAPRKPRGKASAPVLTPDTAIRNEDELTEEQLLFFSTQDPIGTEEGKA